MAVETRILIIEDDKVVAFDLKFMLESLGYAVCGIATNYEDAVKAALAHEPDLALMDIQIKGSRSGIDTSRTFRENFDIPVIFLTSSIELSTIAKAIETEPLAYMVKPVRKEELQSNITLALANHQRNTKLKAELGNISSAMHHLEMPLLITDLDANITYVNRSFEKICNCSLQEIKGGSINDTILLDNSSISEILNSNSELPSGSKIQIKNRENIKVKGAIFPISDEEGKETGYLLSVEIESDLPKIAENILANKDNTYLSDEYFFVKDKGQMHRVKIDDVTYIEALGDYVMVHTDGKRYTTLMTMKKLEQMLPSDKFARIHRSYIAAINKITSINSNDFDIFIGEKRIPIGKTFKQELLKKIKVL